MLAEHQAWTSVGTEAKYTALWPQPQLRQRVSAVTAPDLFSLACARYTNLVNSSVGELLLQYKLPRHCLIICSTCLSIRIEAWAGWDGGIHIYKRERFALCKQYTKRSGRAGARRDRHLLSQSPLHLLGKRALFYLLWSKTASYYALLWPGH